MYKKNRMLETQLDMNEITEGETLEEKLERIVNNNEPITDGAPTNYTDRREGVLAEFDPRTDRWDVAIDATDKISKSKLAKRQELIEELNRKEKGTEEPGSGETPVNSGTSNQE